MKLANQLGIYDMNGNVWEFCFDLNEPERISRGGGWNNDGIEYRVGSEEYGDDPDDGFYLYSFFGFRLAKTK